MGWFDKKEDKEDKVPELLELPKLPEFPGVEEREPLPQLPSFPSNELGTRFSQNAIKDAEDQITENKPIFVVAGRMMAINKFGKTTFIRFKDRTGQLQAYVRKDQIGDIAYDIFKQLDIGDFIGLSGGMFKTKTGENPFFRFL